MLFPNTPASQAKTSYRSRLISKRPRLLGSVLSDCQPTKACSTSQNSNLVRAFLSTEAVPQSVSSLSSSRNLLGALLLQLLLAKRKSS